MSTKHILYYILNFYSVCIRNDCADTLLQYLHTVHVIGLPTAQSCFSCDNTLVQKDENIGYHTDACNYGDPVEVCAAGEVRQRLLFFLNNLCTQQFLGQSRFVSPNMCLDSMTRFSSRDVSHMEINNLRSYIHIPICNASTTFSVTHIGMVAMIKHMFYSQCCMRFKLCTYYFSV